MTFGSVFGRTFSPTFNPKSLASGGADTWWDLNGTITSCVAAYKAVGAADYAASKVNLVNPGTDNLSDGTAYPSWSSNGAWDFIGDINRWLVTPNTLGLMSIAISYVWTYEGNGNYPPLMMNPTGYFNAYRIRRSATNIETATNSFHTGGSRYINGADTAAITFDSRQTLVSNAASTITQKYMIGGNYNPTYSLNANIYAVAFYSAALTQAQASSLSTAMNAL